ncbi:MAG: DUF2868 domain-containing protein [Nitrospirota bacterium]|nr:DUF2868 domain-containing protein [Nitrospirota bacterium]
MKRTTLARILLVQALEESDPQGRHLPLSTRHHATQQARDQHQPSSGHFSEADLSFLSTRSDIVWAFVNKAFPTFAQSCSHLPAHIPSALIAIPALGVGLFMNGLGASQRINLLNFPLLLLLLWNGGMYLSAALLPFWSSFIKTTWLDTVATWLSQGSGSWASRLWRPILLTDPSAASWIQESTKRFTALWWPHIHSAWTERLRQLLHLGAVCMAVGLILGMYIRGLALDYQATWESTFLSPNQVQGLLHMLLSPAAWLLQYPFPDESGIVSLQAPQHGPAAPWIHMWAVTAFALIVVPRSIMVWMSQRTLRQAEKSFAIPLDHPYFVHLLAPDRGQGVQVDILPYSYQPSSKAKNFLDRAFLDLFGNLASIHWHPAMPFGQETPTWLESPTPVRNYVVIFNAGQTPEGEVQGEWLHTIQTQIDAVRSRSRLLVLLDEEPYRQAIEERRVTERRQAWQRLSHQYHLDIVPLDPTTTSQDEFLHQAQTGFWPASG